MELLLRNSMHKDGKSHDVSIYSAPGNSRVKITYEAGNAYEKFVGEMWSGQEWNPIFTMSDLGVWADFHAYNILSPMERKRRAEGELLTKAKEYLKLIIR